MRNVHQLMLAVQDFDPKGREHEQEVLDDAINFIVCAMPMSPAHHECVREWGKMHPDQEVRELCRDIRAKMVENALKKFQPAIAGVGV